MPKTDPVPGQMPLPFEVPTAPKRRKRRAPSVRREQPALDLGVLRRVARRKPGPRWPPFVAVRHDLPAAAGEKAKRKGRRRRGGQAP